MNDKSYSGAHKHDNLRASAPSSLMLAIARETEAAAQLMHQLVLQTVAYTV